MSGEKLLVEDAGTKKTEMNVKVDLITFTPISSCRFSETRTIWTCTDPCFSLFSDILWIISSKKKRKPREEVVDLSRGG